MIQTPSYQEAAVTILTHICAGCRSSLIVVPAVNPESRAIEYDVLCSNCGTGTTGIAANDVGVENVILPRFTRYARFWSYVHLPRTQTGLIDYRACWNWTKSLDPSYGYFAGETRVERAHRYAYMICHVISAIPKGQIIRHVCDNPSCVNPYHLILGTHLENSRDMYLRNRQRGRKLTVTTVMRLLEEIKNGKPIDHLASKYQVQERQVYAVRSGLSWSWATGVPQAYRKPRKKYPGKSKKKAAKV